MEYLLDINNLDKNSLSNLKLHSPIPIQGGSYLAKITLNDNPVLFQMPKCSTKKGIVSTSVIVRKLIVSMAQLQL